MNDKIRETKRDSLKSLDDYFEHEEGFISLDTNDNITYINEKICRRLGYEKQELIGKPVSDIISDLEYQRISKYLDKRKEGFVSSYLIELKSRQGTQILFKVSAAPIISENKYSGRLGILSDISQERENVDSVFDTVKYHELMVKYLPLGLLILSDEGKIINMNPAFTKITGIKFSQMCGKNIYELPFLENLSYRYLIDNLLHHKVNFDQETDKITMPNGKEVFLRFRGFQLDIKSDVFYYLLVFGDITPRKLDELEIKDKMTELRKLEKKLKKQIIRKENEIKEKEWQLLEEHRIESNNALLAKIAHYWRQPLNNATILIQSLSDDFEYNDLDEERFNDKIEQAVKQLANLSQTLETFRYISTNDPGITQFDIEDAIMRTVNLMDPDFRNSNVKLHLALEKDIYAEGYPRRFSQALVNIFDNSLQAFAEREVAKPELIVKTVWDDKKIVLTIADNGRGIDADIATLIFDPYFTTRKKHAQGLGLYQTKRLIEDLFNGSIEYKRIENGSEFKIIIPGYKRA